MLPFFLQIMTITSGHSIITSYGRTKMALNTKIILNYVKSKYFHIEREYLNNMFSTKIQ